MIREIRNHDKSFDIDGTLSSFSSSTLMTGLTPNLVSGGDSDLSLMFLIKFKLVVDPDREPGLEALPEENPELEDLGDSRLEFPLELLVVFALGGLLELP